MGLTVLRQLAACLGLLMAGLCAQAQPVALRGLPLVDQHARPITAAALQGRVVLMHFVFTACSSTCPLQVHELAELHTSLPQVTRQGLVMLSVTVDPLSDTPAALAAYAARVGADRPGWRFVTGAPQAVYTLLDRMQALDKRKPQAGPEDHRTALLLFDGRGELVQRYSGTPVDRARLAREITQLQAQARSASTTLPHSTP